MNGFTGVTATASKIFLRFKDVRESRPEASFFMQNPGD